MASDIDELSVNYFEGDQQLVKDRAHNTQL